jgi:tetratricopeptide (TPR) repeat protein
MSDTYFAELTQKFTALKLEEQVQQVKRWISEKPHNEKIIPVGERCRAADFVDNLKPAQMGQLNLAYGDNLNQNQIAEFFSRLGEKALMDNICKNDEAALPKAIFLNCLAAYHTSLDDTASNRGVILSRFARSLMVQWQKTPTDELLDETIVYFRKAITYGPPHGLYRNVHFLDLGQQLRERYSKTHNSADFENAISSFERSVIESPSGKPIVAFQVARLNQEKNEFEGVEALKALNEYIETLSEALRTIPTDFSPFDYRESLSSIYRHLGYALARRFDLTKSDPDFQSAINAFQSARAAPQHGPNDKLSVFLGMGRLMLAKFNRTGSIELAKEAEQNFKNALQVQCDSKDAMESLGELYRLRAHQNGSTESALEGTRLLEKCVEGDGPHSYVLLLKVANAYGDQYEHLGKKEDIDRAIDLLFQAIQGDAIPPTGSKAEGECMLANGLIMRFQQAEDEDDIELALSIIERARNKVMDGQTRNYCYRTHGKVLFARYQARRDVSDLDLAIDCYQNAVNVPDAGVLLFNAYNDLGNALLDKYRATGDTQSILASTKSFETALHSLQSSAYKGDNMTETRLLHGLANTQYIQFEVSQRLSDIDTAVAHYQHCFNQTPSGHIIRVSRAGSLARALQKRFDLTNKIEDAQKSQAVLLEVLNSGLTISPLHLCDLQTNLGSAYLRCYLFNEEPSYLDHAAKHYQKALASGCKRLSYIRTAALNLSRVCRHKAKHTSNVEDLKLALQLFRQMTQTLGTLGVQDPQFEITLVNIAELVFAIVGFPGAEPVTSLPFIDIIVKLIPFFAKSKTLPRHSIALIYIKLAIFRYHATLQAEVSLKLVKAAAEELPGSVLLQSLNRTEQLRVIRNLSTVPSIGVVFSLIAGETAQSALQLFEASRSVLWDNVLTSKLDDQTTSQLHAFPELKSRFEELRQELTKQENVDVILDPSSTRVLRQGERFGQAMSYNQVLDEIRSKPGLENFLRLPRDLSSLLKYASEGPIVIVNGTVMRSDAIIICTDGIFNVNLPLFTDPVYKKMLAKQTQAFKILGSDLETSNRLLEEVLETLWTVAAEPVLDFLGFRGEQEASDPLPRVWWLTTGWISNLPIHAAGDHKAFLNTGCKLSVMDRIVSSYIGNIRALDHLRGRQRTTSGETAPDGQEKRALLVKMPITPDMPGGDLPYAEEEAEELQKICKQAGFRCKALNKPKTATVLQMAKGADLVHFACHGISSEADPAESMLRLTDWKTRPLSIGELLKTNDLSCQLVYLSACETALNKFRPLEDEGLHIAGGFQMAGAINVVASLWRIDDAVSADVSKGFYSGIAGPSGLDFGKSACSLRATLYGIRGKGVPAVLWASYIHLGP